MGTFFGKIQGLPTDYLIRTLWSHDLESCECTEQFFLNEPFGKIWGFPIDCLIRTLQSHDLEHCKCTRRFLHWEHCNQTGSGNSECVCNVLDGFLVGTLSIPLWCTCSVPTGYTTPCPQCYHTTMKLVVREFDQVHWNWTRQMTHSHQGCTRPVVGFVGSLAQPGDRDGRPSWWPYMLINDLDKSCDHFGKHKYKALFPSFNPMYHLVLVHDNGCINWIQRNHRQLHQGTQMLILLIGRCMDSTGTMPRRGSHVVWINVRHLLIRYQLKRQDRSNWRSMILQRFQTQIVWTLWRHRYPATCFVGFVNPSPPSEASRTCQEDLWRFLHFQIFENLDRPFPTSPHFWWLQNDV